MSEAETVGENGPWAAGRECPTAGGRENVGLPIRAGPGPGALAGGRDVGIGPRNNKTTSRPLIRGARLAVESFTEMKKTTERIWRLNES